jgi:hypothetical protein
VATLSAAAVTLQSAIRALQVQRKVERLAKGSGDTLQAYCCTAAVILQTEIRRINDRALLRNSKRSLLVFQSFIRGHIERSSFVLQRQAALELQTGKVKIFLMLSIVSDSRDHFKEITGRCQSRPLLMLELIFY